MLCHRNEMKSETREKARGGEGTVTMVHLVAGNGAVQKNTGMVAEVTLPPGASIGKHSHTEDIEYYIILNGSGTVNDNGTEKPVVKGDVMITGNGESHSIANTGSEPLVFQAVVVNN